MKDLGAKRLSLTSIVARAIAIEADDPRLTGAEIRAIAAELDISPHAVEMAIREASEDSASPAPVARRARWGLAAAVLAGGGAAGLGITLAAKLGGVDALVTTAMFASVSTVFVNLWHATRVNGRSRYVMFNVVNAATWTAIGIGVAPMIVDLSPVVFGMGSAMGGTLLIALRDRRRYVDAQRITAAHVEPLSTERPASNGGVFFSDVALVSA